MITPLGGILRLYDHIADLCDTDKGGLPVKELTCILEKNACYQKGDKLNPTHIIVHSTGANNPYLLRYVNPHAAQTAGLAVDGKAVTRDEIGKLLGKNVYGNHWNRGNLYVCVHGFIGRLYDGTLAYVQTLPYDMACWGVGSGSNGSYNTCAIQFEICEDSLLDGYYCKKTYDIAAQLCARLCKTYAIPPENILSHREAWLAGMGSGHADPTHWWGKHHLDMDTFRAEVKKQLSPAQIPAGKPAQPAVEQLYRIRRSWQDKASQLGAYRNLEYAKAACPAGYAVYDASGKVVYSRAETVSDAKPDYARSYNDAFSGIYCVNLRSGAPLRAGSSENKPLIYLLPKGANVTCYGYYTGDWLFVKSEGSKTGYVHKKYLTEI